MTRSKDTIITSALATLIPIMESPHRYGSGIKQKRITDALHWLVDLTAMAVEDGEFGSTRIRETLNQRHQEAIGRAGMGIVRTLDPSFPLSSKVLDDVNECLCDLVRAVLPGKKTSPVRSDWASREMLEGDITWENWAAQQAFEYYGYRKPATHEVVTNCGMRFCRQTHDFRLAPL